MKNGAVQLRDPKNYVVDPECIIPDPDPTLKIGKLNKKYFKKIWSKTLNYYSKLF
jgi:hypothetical protein